MTEHADVAEPTAIVFDTLEHARARRSAKWTLYDDDVLPMPVAEMDVRLAPAVREALTAAIERSDTSYPPFDDRLTEAFTGFAARRWQWDVDPAQVFAVPDVAAGVQRVLSGLLPDRAVGRRVVINTPVYPSFFAWGEQLGVDLVEVPMLADPESLDRGYRLDLEGLERAFEQADAYLLCHPHNPLGHLHSREELAAVAELADRHDVLVVSDEIHAPLTMPGETFVPFLTVSGTARRVGVAVHAASKAFNVAGLKCALVVTADGALRERVAGTLVDHRWTPGILGVLAAEAAYSDGDAWLDALDAALDANHRLLVGLVHEHLPHARIIRARSTFLAWIDLSEYEIDGEPADLLLREGRVALGLGPTFGAPGAGHVRVNVGCGQDVIREGVRRMARVLES